MGQDSWARNIDQKVAGRAVDYHAQAYADVVGGRNEEAVAIFPGLFVVQGTADDDVKIDDGGVTGADILGLAVDNENRERVGSTLLTTGYVQNALVPVARSGRWYVNCGSTASKGGTVYVRFAAGTTSVIGEAYSSADTATCDAINAKFAETITAPGLVAVDLNMAQV